MCDEPREFPLAAQAGAYDLLPNALGDIEYESDDSNGPSPISTPQRAQSPDLCPVSRTSTRLLTLKRALIPQDHLGARLGVTTLVSDDMGGYIAPGDFLSDPQPGDDGYEAPQETASTSGGGQPSNPAAQSFLDQVDTESQTSPIQNNFYQRYEDNLARTVSAAVDSKPLCELSLEEVQLNCVDETRHASPRHRMLLQAAFDVPGFDLKVFDMQWFREDDDGEGESDVEVEKGFHVYIPYSHRRLWVSLTTPTAIATEDRYSLNEIVADRVKALFEAALVLYRPGVHSLHSRAFARLVSQRLKGTDPAWKDFNTTTDIRFALDTYGRGRAAYRAKETNPRYDERMEGAVFRRVQDLGDAWASRARDEENAALRGEPVDPNVERANCPDSDRDEEAISLAARSNRPPIIRRVPVVPYIGFDADPHDESSDED